MTNFRSSIGAKNSTLSRGELVAKYLRGSLGPADYVARVHPDAGRYNGFNLLVGNLVPSLSTVAILVGSLQTVAVPPPPVGWKFATLDITGKLLGKTDDDDFYLALFKDGTTVKLLDASTDMSPPAAPQTQRRFVMQKPDAVAPGQYLVLYRVNGQQARQGLVINLV